MSKWVALWWNPESLNIVLWAQWCNPWLHSFPELVPTSQHLLNWSVWPEEQIMHVRNNGQLAENSYACLCVCVFFKLVLEESKTFFSWEKLLNLFIGLQSLIFFFNLTFYRKKRKSLLTVIQIPKQFFFFFWESSPLCWQMPPGREVYWTHAYTPWGFILLRVLKQRRPSFPKSFVSVSRH